ASFRSSSARVSRVRPARVLAFVPAERTRLGGLPFAPSPDKVTSSAQSLVPLPVGPAKDRAILTEPHDELAPRHSITSSARTRSVGGTAQPRALPAFRLIMNSNLTGCSIGRSPGLAPLRILSMYAAARRKLSGTLGP